jgi:histidinol-phosphate aminotransferase
MIKPLRYVSDITPYVPGKPIKELEREYGIRDSIKLASNENPLGPSQKALEALRQYIQMDCEIHRYPEGSGYYLKGALLKKLSEYGSMEEGKSVVTRDNIILGNGSNEIIDIAVRTFMGPGDEAIMATPSFIVYSMAVMSVGGKTVEVPLKSFRHDLEQMADSITEKTKMVFIANPNNPTGTINKKDEFERFMNMVSEDVLVVIDEAYREYVSDPDYPDTLKYLNSKKILILRTFSKIYGLAGLRIGYGLSSADIITEMNKIREPFNTNTLAQLAAMYALEDDEHVKKTIELNEKGKFFLYRELEKLGLRYVPTEANFIYILLDYDSKSLYESLLKKGVIVRPVGPKEIRVTIGLPEENERFIESLKTL